MPTETASAEVEAIEPGMITGDADPEPRAVASAEAEASAPAATPHRTETPAHVLNAWKEHKEWFQLGHDSKFF